MKVCSKCKEEKPLDDFSANKKTKDGKQKYCKTCKAAVDLDYYNRNKEKYSQRNKEAKARNKEWYIELKSKLKCKCGQDHIAALTFHHRNPEEKEFNIAEMSRYTYSIEKIEAEIAKCDVLCFSCHMILEYEKRNAVLV